MSRRNHLTTPSGQNLDHARREYGRRSPQAGAAAAGYGREMVRRIATQVEQDAATTQRRWDRNGTPWWMRVKTALGLADRRG